MASDPQDTFWWRLVHLNPALYKGLIVAVISLLAVWGIHVSPELPNNLDALVGCLAAIAQALWTKTSMTPNAQVVVAVENPHQGGDAVVPGEAVTSASDAAVLEAASMAGPDAAGV